MEPLYECKIEIFEGIDVKVIFFLEDDSIEIVSTHIIDANNKLIEVDFSNYALENFEELVRDELDSLPFKDSTVKFIIDSPN